jgi:hypothetical protein
VAHSLILYMVPVTKPNNKQGTPGGKQKNIGPQNRSRRSVEAGRSAPPLPQVLLQRAEPAAVLRARDGIGVLHVQQREAQVRPHVRRRVRLVVQAVQLSGAALVGGARRALSS